MSAGADRPLGASPEEAPVPAVSSAWIQNGHLFSFFQLVDLLLRRQPDAVPPGTRGPVERECVRFRPTASLGFAARDVEEVDVDPTDSRRTRVTVNFMGLYGPASPMPNHFTEQILWAGEDGATLRDFLDLFHHRVLSLVYRAWTKYRYALQFEPSPPDPFTRRILCLLGLGTPGMAEAAGLAFVPLLATAGAFASRRRSAVGLEGLLAAHFPGVPVCVISCVPRRAPIPADQRLRLGARARGLGRDACLGETVADRAGAFRIVLGPLDEATYRGLLPGSEGLDRLVRLTRLYVSDPLRFDVVLVLRAPSVPALRLSPASRLPLGQMSWIRPSGRSDGRASISIHRIDPLGALPPTRALPAARPIPARAAA